MKDLRGALLGFAVGDAIGAATELMTNEEIRRKYGYVDKILGGGPFGVNAGSVTDDTGMMLAIADAYSYSGTLEGFMKLSTHYLREWFRSEPKGLGGMTGYVLDRAVCFDDYHRWMEIALRAQYKLNRTAKGNGALTRAMVPAIFGDYEAAIMQGALTHNSEYSERHIVYYVNLFTQGFSKASYGFNTDSLCESVIGCMQRAINLGLSYTEAVLEIVNAGGDTDSIAAAVGGLLGYLDGQYVIPKEWIAALDPEVVRHIDSLCIRLKQRPL